MTVPNRDRPPLRLLSVVIPARDEEGCVGSTLERLSIELCSRSVPHEIVVVDDGSTDRTWETLKELEGRLPHVRPVRNTGPSGFGRAVVFGFRQMRGDAVCVMMADESDNCGDVAAYWNLLNQGWDAVFGSRFVKGGGTVGYPWFKLVVNRLANLFIRVLFGLKFNDVTNAFKAYRRTTIEGCEPILSPHFNLTVELPLKTIVRGYSWTTIPTVWRNRSIGASKLKFREMGSRYLFICLYVLLEKYFSLGDYRKDA